MEEIEEGFDARDDSDPDYNPEMALVECHNLWASGAWPDENAIGNLEETMSHIGHLLEHRKAKQ